MAAYANFLTKVLKVESGVVARRIVQSGNVNGYLYEVVEHFPVAAVGAAGVPMEQACR